MSKQIQIEDALCFNLYTASRMMTQVYSPYLYSIGLTYPQFLVMNLLWSKDGVTVKTLGERLYLDSGTLTPLLKRLISQELIVKKRSTEDERAVLISLTKKGKDLQKKTKDIPMEMFCQLNVSMERFVEIRDGVKEILHNLAAKVAKQNNENQNRDSAELQNNL